MNVFFMHIHHENKKGGAEIKIKETVKKMKCAFLCTHTHLITKMESEYTEHSSKIRA